MNEKEAAWTLSHDLIEMFSKDFGFFKGIALKYAYDGIYGKSDEEIHAVILRMREVLASIDEPNAKKK